MPFSQSQIAFIGSSSISSAVTTTITRSLPTAAGPTSAVVTESTFADTNTPTLIGKISVATNDLWSSII